MALLARRSGSFGVFIPVGRTNDSVSRDSAFCPSLTIDRRAPYSSRRLRPSYCGLGNAVFAQLLCRALSFGHWHQPTRHPTEKDSKPRPGTALVVYPG